MSGLAFEWEVEFEPLVAATERCLWGFAPGWVNIQQVQTTVGSSTFKLSQDELGDLGTVTVRKLRTGWTQVEFSGPPLISQRSPTDNERAAIEAMTVDDQRRQARIELSRRLSRERDDLQRRREHHHNDIVMAYLNRLYAENIWPERRLFEGKIGNLEQFRAQLEIFVSKYFPPDKGHLLSAGRVEEINVVHQRTAVFADLANVGTIIVGYLEFTKSDGRQPVYQVTFYGNDVPGLLRTAEAFFNELTAFVHETDMQLAASVRERQHPQLEPSSPHLRRYNLHWGYFIAALLLAVLIFIGSLIAFPEWSQSVRWLLVLAVLIISGVVQLIANWRQAFDVSPDSKQNVGATDEQYLFKPMLVLSPNINISPPTPSEKAMGWKRSWFLRLKVENKGETAARNYYGRLLKITDEQGKQLAELDPLDLYWTRQDKPESFEKLDIQGNGDFTYLDVAQVKELEDVLTLRVKIPHGHRLIVPTDNTRKSEDLPPGIYYVYIAIYADNTSPISTWYKIKWEANYSVDCPCSIVPGTPPLGERLI